VLHGCIRQEMSLSVVATSDQGEGHSGSGDQGDEMVLPHRCSCAVQCIPAEVEGPLGVVGVGQGEG